MAQLFTYTIDIRFVALWAPFGVRPSKDGVFISDDGRFRVTYGFLRLETDLSNVVGAHITKDYRWWTAVGPRRSMVDDGLTFGTNTKAGVCVHFREKVPSVLSRKGHSAVTVTVADLEGLVSELSG